MDDKLVFTLLGTGSSGGVPRVGNDWGQCDPNNQKNRRRRCALLIERIDSQQRKTTVLVDAGVDLREQLLSANVASLDAVLLTHSHADHIFGLDDLRQLAISLRRHIDVYMDEATSVRVMQPFSYCFVQPEGTSYPAFCREHRITHGQPLTIDGEGGSISVTTALAEHGDIHALGFRVNDVVYLPDIKRLADQPSANVVANARVLILDALRYKSHPTHMNVEEALQFIHEVRPARAVLTNMHCDLDYDTLHTALPANVEPGFDGMTIV